MTTETTTTTIRVGHSPDPDDAFMFYALPSDKIDTGGLEIRPRPAGHRDPEPPRLPGELEITAVSIHAYAHLADKYALLPSGAAWATATGRCRRPRAAHARRPAAGRKIAIPGKLTTAYLALRLWQPDVTDRRSCRSTASSTSCKDGKADAGVIIHEGQLTYADRGCSMVVDLGEWWKGETGLPLPLGGNVIRGTSAPTSSSASAGC